MSKIEKLIKKLRDPEQFRNVKFDSLVSIVVNKLGFKKGTDTGSHFSFINIKYEDYLPEHLKQIVLVRPHGGGGLSRRTVETVVDVYDILLSKGVIK